MIDINQTLQVIILTTGVIGQLLIAHQKKEAFIVWLISNAALIYVSFQQKLWGMTLLYIFFSIMCFYSMCKWQRLENKQLSK